MILDTNALSAFADGDENLLAVVRGSPRLFLPVIVLGEFRYGIAGSRHRRTYETWLSEALVHFEVLEVSDETTHAYASVRMSLKQKGRPIPANDVWIAAIAIEHRLPIVSRDSDFDAVVGLTRIEW